uniref:Uncharacterized protein n=1 Tax=Caenorhabditis japonica TaxID=281687 RepID=A0A8R1IP94_CAEJA
MANGERMIEQYALPLLESIVEEVKWLAEHTKHPAPGTKVDAKVTKELDDLTLVEFEHNGKKIAGVVHKKEKSTEEAVPKKKKKAATKSLIVVDINHSTSEVVLAAPFVDSTRIVAIRRDYLCAISPEGLVYLPTRLHPNHLPITDEKLKIHSVVDLNTPKSVGDGVFVATRGGGDVDDVTRTTLIAKTFIGDVKKIQKPAAETGGVSSQKAISIKNFGIYEGIVIGQATVEKDQKKNGLFAEIRLPGDNPGRLHVSEFPINLQNCEDPLAQFLKNNLHKKVIAGKVRATDLSYKSNYTIGELVKCFGSATLTDNQEIRVEVNPLWTGTISRENLSDDLKVESAEDGIVDL